MAWTNTEASSNGLQPTSDGLQPNSNGLHPSSNGLLDGLKLFFLWLDPMTEILEILCSDQSKTLEPLDYCGIIEALFNPLVLSLAALRLRMPRSRTPESFFLKLHGPKGVGLVLQSDLLISLFEVTWACKRSLRHSKEVTLKKLG